MRRWAMVAVLTGATWSAGGAPVGPAVVTMLPLSGSDAIDIEQRFLVTLSAPIVEATLPAVAWCEIASRGERVPIVVVDGDERDEALKARNLRDPAVIARTLLVHCGRTLPHDTAVRVVWGQQRFRYKTRGPFTAEWSRPDERNYRETATGLSNSRSIATSITMWHRL